MKLRPQSRHKACSKTLAVFQSPAPTIASSRSPPVFFLFLLLLLLLPPLAARPLACSRSVNCVCLSLPKLPRVHSAHRRGQEASQKLRAVPFEAGSVSVLDLCRRDWPGVHQEYLVCPARYSRPAGHQLGTVPNPSGPPTTKDT
jgi:hypothetical protein